MATAVKQVSVGNVSYRMYEVEGGSYIPHSGLPWRIHIAVNPLPTINMAYRFTSPPQDLLCKNLKFEDEEASVLTSYSIRVNDSFYLFKTASITDGDVTPGEVVIPSQSDIEVIAGRSTLKCLLSCEVVGVPEFLTPSLTLAGV